MQFVALDLVPRKDVTDQDLESDEATWALYENWCKAYSKERDHGEITRRFPTFKASAKYIQRFKRNRPRLGVFADGLEEQDGASKEMIECWERFRRNYIDSV